MRLEVASLDLDGSGVQHGASAAGITAAEATSIAPTAGSAAYPSAAAAAGVFASALAAQGAAHGGALTGMGGKVGSSGSRYMATDSTSASHVQDSIAV